MKRFYKATGTAAMADGWRVLLDGKPVKTPAKASLLLPSEALAHAIAREWDQQVDNIDPLSMPLARYANSAIDRVAPNQAAVAATVSGFARTDLLCYPAEEPDDLVTEQQRHWLPVLAWAKAEKGVALTQVSGIMPVEQDEQALAKADALAFGFEAFALAALSEATHLLGSLLLSLALFDQYLTLDEAWAAATIEERFQAQQWGPDKEAEDRLAQRYGELKEAERFYRLLLG